MKNIDIITTSESIEVNKNLAFNDVYDVLINLHKQKKPPFDIAIRPQDPEYLPRNLNLETRQHALFLFYACLYMRGRIKSHQAFERLKILHEEYPELFDPKEIQRDRFYYEDELYVFLQKAGLKVDAISTARGWIHNSIEIYDYWDSDPRKLFDCLNEIDRQSPEAFELVCKNIIRSSKRKNKERRGFYGFRHKMVSMLSYFLEDAKIILPYLFPSPVDFHVLRINIMQNILNTNGLDKKGIPVGKFLPSARELTSEYSIKRNIKPVFLADSLWIYSRDMCSNNLNAARFKIKEKGKGRKTEILIANKIKWTAKKISKYYEFCGGCPLKENCLKFMSSKGYYASGHAQTVEQLVPDQYALVRFTRRSKRKEKPIVKRPPQIQQIAGPPEASLFDEQK